MGAVIDIASCRFTGLACADHLRIKLISDALTSAVPARTAALRRGLPFRPRLQYTSATFATLAEDCQVTRSMGRIVQRWDDASAENFFASLKGELIDRWPRPSRAVGRRAIVEYSGWYNRTRPHSTLDCLSLAEFEATMISRPSGR